MKIEKITNNLLSAKERGIELIIRKNKIFIKEPIYKDKSLRMTASCRAQKNGIYTKHYGFCDSLISSLEKDSVFSQYK